MAWEGFFRILDTSEMVLEKATLMKNHGAIRKGGKRCVSEKHLHLAINPSQEFPPALMVHRKKILQDTGM